MNSYLKKQVMYCMITAIENDFVQCFKTVLKISDIPLELLEKAKNAGGREDLESILRSLDLQSFIEIANKNACKLGMSITEKNFLNKEFSEIIPIRNKVMHPRILEFYDYPKLNGCFSELETAVNFIEWTSVKKIKLLLKDDPDQLPLLPSYLKKNDNIIENIPEVTDFDETSFIGRKKEIGELKQKLFKKNVHILSIIGDGGVGKTAIALKLLYDILDDPTPSFELVIWVSLKTSTLNNVGFEEINGAIRTIPDMYCALEKFIGKSTSIKEELIDISKAFKTLFVLDNLETINSDEIKDFLDELSENAKILITSRIGLGEMEYRYRLNGLNDEDVIEYLDVLLDLYGFEGRFTTKEKENYAITIFLSNPLAIKWFVRGLAQGNSPEKLLENKSDVINFCMSNVYEKLSVEAKKILDVVLVLYDEITYAELLYFLSFNSSEDITIRNAINELVKSNFMNQQHFSNSKISLTSFAREYLGKISLYDKESKRIVSERQQKLKSFVQDMQVKINTNSLSNVYCFRFLDGKKDKVVAAYYLNEALNKSKLKDLSGANELIDLAEKLSPEYFECNKVRGFLYSSTNPDKAKEEYKTALNKAETPDELLTAQILYSGFLIKNNEYSDAILLLESINDNSHSYDSDLHIKFELIKAYASCGRFGDAHSTVSQIDPSKIESIKQTNIYLTRKAEILRRESEALENREFIKKIKLLKKAAEIVRVSPSPDSGIYDSLANILYCLSYYYFQDDICVYILEILNNNYTYLCKTKKYKKFALNMQQRIDSIPTEELKEQFAKYIYDINEALPKLSSNEGIIYSLHSGFGFLKNNEYPGGIYFKIPKEKAYHIGDIITFEKLYILPKGPMIKEYILKYSFIELINN